MTLQRPNLLELITVSHGKSRWMTLRSVRRRAGHLDGALRAKPRKALRQASLPRANRLLACIQVTVLLPAQSHHAADFLQACRMQSDIS